MIILLASIACAASFVLGACIMHRSWLRWAVRNGRGEWKAGITGAPEFRWKG